MAKTRVHIYVSGRVQGVFFRQTTMQLAQKYGVKGWVRNLPDGRVEAIFEGNESVVKALVDFCRHGPSTARVDKIEINNDVYREEFNDFTMR